MRDIFGKIAIITVMGLLPSMASAQLQLGVKGGLNLTRMSLDTDDIFTAKNGFFIGPSVRLIIPQVGLGLDVSALYDQRDVSIGEDSKVDIKHKMVSVPVNLRWDVFSLGSLGIFLYAGPQFDFNVGSDEKVLDAARTWKFEESTTSVNVGGGVMLMKNLQLSVNYNVVCGKTAEITSLNLLLDEVKKYKAKTNAWQVALAWYF